MPEFRHGNSGFRLRAWLGFVLIIGFLLWNNFFLGETKARQKKNERAEQFVTALRATKGAYDDWENFDANKGKWSRFSQQQVEDALDGWKKLADSPKATAADWRRLGIVQYEFGKYKESFRSFDKAAELSVKPLPTLLARDDFDLNPPAPAKSPEAERLLWRDIYERAIRTRDVPKLRAQLADLRLGWFEHLAAAQLYRKAVEPQNADAETDAALASCYQINAINSARMLLMLWGIGMLAWYGIKYLIQRERPTTLIPMMDMPPAPLLANPFSYQARISAFLSYLVIPIAAIIPLMFVRGYLRGVSPLALNRLNVALYFVVAGSAVGLALTVLRRNRSLDDWRENCSLFAILGRLGLPGREPLKNALRGVPYYGMGMAAMIVAVVISTLLFSRFKTPSHPLVYQIMVMHQPVDRLLLFLETAIGAAITEEIMFRGILYPAFRERYGAVRGILITSALFALVHPQLPGGFLPLMTLGAAFNVAYEKRGSLLPGMVMHAMNNGILLLSEFALMAQ